MSIFPKRTVAGNNVTIHWNFNPPPRQEQPLCPWVRIGVIDPEGNCTMLLEQHILLLPSAGMPAPQAMLNEKEKVYLNKHTPLLLLATYLAGKQKRERLIDILHNIQSGRHYYFTYTIPCDAKPGKYKLLSEIHIDGAIKYSGTAAEDFFHVEQVIATTEEKGIVTLTNQSPEPVPVKLIQYAAGNHHQPEAIQVIEIPGKATHQVNMDRQQIFLVYNEERIMIPLHGIMQKRCIRNQQYPGISKQEEGAETIYVLPKEGDNAYRLTGMQQQIWKAADGVNTREQIRGEHNSDIYDEMLAHRLIEEIA